MTQKGNVSYQYDSENRLVQVTTPTETVTYTYDGDGNRISKTVNGQTTSYIYDISEGFPQLLVEMDGTGTIAKQYINGTSVIGSVYGPRNELYCLYDGLGSVIAATDAAGTIAAAYDYDAFGALKSETGSVPNDLKFIGEQNDSETGLIYLRAGYYDPTTGRFITKDTFAGYSTDPQSLNRYVYAYNNPVNMIDPSGHSPLEQSSSWFDRMLNSRFVNSIQTVNNYFNQADPNGWKTLIGDDVNLFLTPNLSVKEKIRTYLLNNSIVGFLKGKGLGNPFKGKTFEEIDEMFTKKGFEKRGPDPVNGKGGYVNPTTGRSYYLDKGGQYKKGYEAPHVDVNRLKTDKSDLVKKKYFLD